MLNPSEIDALFDPDLPEPSFWEQQYPARQLSVGAEVTRFCPSPTGHAHIGGIHVAAIDAAIARQSGGVYFVRIEDTDQAREVEGAVERFDRAFRHFGVASDETDATGLYGPYTQSRRARIYQTYVRELMRQGRAYPCFATKDELEALRADQLAKKVPSGYYGQWAPWRDADDDAVRERLAAGVPYVVRFRSPGTGERTTFHDRIRGTIEMDDNRADTVILKASNTEPRLPTYHLAHAVDDHLMGVTIVIRGDEWLSSVPVHHQLFDALGFPRIPYAHIGPLMKQEGKTRRKLSKRKDPEADVEYYAQAGYPTEAVLYYLRGLANGRLAEMPLNQALREPLRLEECGVTGALVDLAKLEDICADHVAALPGPAILERVKEWAKTYDLPLTGVLEAEEDLALRALSVERDGFDNPRKDLRKWADFRTHYGFFFQQLFATVTDPADPRFGGLAPDVVQDLSRRLLDRYQSLEGGDAWFDQIRAVAAELNFAVSARTYRQNPGLYTGSIKEASQVIRVLLTGSTRSPALHLVATTLGEAEVRRRLNAVRTA
ncbi:glutamate--tRNA ligase [Streptomyces sp. FH025]|uniref:glutamate--tRNA ligase n=1 Tax=Streptomyces sp. FH025 TaxID=2815937 RepID=UPI001A9EBF28|nr:glutamate--tRNA ligase family protein [Streptomyces sp. FH025]MBO1417990.1 glutamate--tRNA ligase [Streptomyces sp. FH025]